jgi:hypothetical protein
MAERHTNGGDRYRPVRVTGPGNGRGTTLDRPYAWNGEDRERDAWVASRLAAVRAQVGRRAPGLTGGPDPEWHSGLAAEACDDMPPAPEPAPEPAGWCDDCGYRTDAPGHQRECGPS